MAWEQEDCCVIWSGATDVENKESGEAVASATNTDEGSPPEFVEAIGDFLS